MICDLQRAAMLIFAPPPPNSQWLAVNCKGNPVELLAALDVHTCPDQSERAIKAALTTRLTSSKGGGGIAIRNPKAWLPDAAKSKVTPEGAFYWRLLAR